MCYIFAGEKFPKLGFRDLDKAKSEKLAFS